MKNEKIVLSNTAHSQRLKSFRTSAALMLTALLLVVAATTGATAQTLTTLHSFDGTDGAYPPAGLVQATDGKLYGTTYEGANTICGEGNGCGTVFKITPAGTLTTLYNFCSQGGGECTDGEWPYAALVQDTNGNVYGTTNAGGGGNCGYGCGTVFKITPSGTLTTLHSFDDTDGANPEAGLVQDTNGNLYGTTPYGGANGYGTVFKITPSGTLTTLHSFDGTDGAYPRAGLVQATDGNLYGTTFGGGGNTSCPNGLNGHGCGTVFKITPSGTLTTLHSFDDTDGAWPDAGLVQATNGKLYGTTSRGGILTDCVVYFHRQIVSRGCGTIFELDTTGKETVLHRFDDTDGRYPSGLVQDTNGNFYGTSNEGGANTCAFGNCGTVFKITPSGTLTTLHSFDGTDGAYPLGLVQDTNGNFYGTTYRGGDSTACGIGGCGTVFRLSVGLRPFVETQPTSGKVGAAVKILGTTLTGATSVKFNGTAAVFIVKSSSLITTTVPEGGTTGTVEVTTPKGTLKSNVFYTVTK